MIPAAFEYDRAGSVDEALRPRRRPRRQGHRRRPEPPAAPQAAARVGRHPHRHRAARRAPGRPNQLADGSVEIGPLTTYAEIIESTQLDWRARRDAADRRRPGPQPWDGRRLDQPRRPSVRRPGHRARARLPAVLRSSRGERTVSLDEFFKGPFETAMEGDELVGISCAGRCRPASGRRTRSWPSRHPATRSWASPRSWAARWLDRAHRRRLTGLHDHAFRATRSNRRCWARTARHRRSRRPLHTSTTTPTVTPTSTRTAPIERRWRSSIPVGRSKRRSRARPTAAAIASPAACASSDSSWRPPGARLAGAVLARDLRIGGERWSKGRVLSAADLAVLGRPRLPMSASRRSR